MDAVLIALDVIGWLVVAAFVLVALAGLLAVWGDRKTKGQHTHEEDSDPVPAEPDRQEPGVSSAEPTV